MIYWTVRRSAFAFIVLLTFATTAAAAEAVNGERVQAPVYTDGSWTYHADHRTYLGLYKSDMLTGDFQVSVQDGSAKIARLDGRRLASEFNEFCPLEVVLPTPEVTGAAPKYFNFPLWVGKDWRGSEFLRHKWRSANAKVIGMESVVTPAGTFNAYKIERAAWMFVGTANYYVNQTYFYSRQTRSMVKYQCREEYKDLVGDPRFGLLEEATIELINFKAE
jgi:hypothetical protein